MRALADRIADWYLKKGPAFRSVVKSLQTFLLLYAGAVLENQVQVISEGGLMPKQWWHAGVVFIIVVALGVVSYNVRLVLERRQKAEAEKRTTILYAASLTDQYYSSGIRLVQEARAKQEPQALVAALITSAERLNVIVKDAYSVFESTYGESLKIDDRIDFEATFMTVSYEDDGITIAAYANRNGRAPTSLRDRKNNMRCYDATETAQMYREKYYRLRIISDTNTPNYAELYPGQKTRLKSSIVCPVLDVDNRLLGTLVVHCNRVGFFREPDRKYWQELSDVFTRRLALEKIKLDCLVSGGADGVLHTSVPKPF